MARKHRVLALDWIMLTLAIVSVAMLVYETWGSPTPEQTRNILRADLIIVGIFVVEFSYRWMRDDRPKTFFWRNWYGMSGVSGITADVEWCCFTLIDQSTGANYITFPCSC